MLVICAVIAGCDEWTAIEAYGKAKLGFLKSFLQLENGIPSHDTLGDIFAKIDPDAFEQCFLNWTLGVCQLSDGEVISIDGKQLRGSYDRASKKAPIHMVSAWANANRMVLGQVKVDNKSNEITAIPALLRVLVLKNCLVTIDALGCQRAIAQQIIEAEADYLLALKGNQSSLQDQVRTSFERQVAFDNYTEYNNDHGRLEKRHYQVITDLKWIEDQADWGDLQTLVKAESTITYKSTAQTATQVRYYISSLPMVDKQKDILRIVHGVRAHWGIETSLHWCLDVVFQEDDSPMRKGYSDQNFSLVRKIALNVLREDKTAKGGLKTRRMRAGWDDNYLTQLLKI
jgi:predicted transposase YbfD/YdcC